MFLLICLKQTPQENPPWAAADARLSETTDTLIHLTDRLEDRLRLVMGSDDALIGSTMEQCNSISPAVKTLHQYADEIFVVNERLSAILDRLDI